MVTISDVAKHAGVSIGTVSNVLNDLPTVSEENREKVTRAIAKLGYRRNNAASQLRSNISKNIGLIIPTITNPFYPEFTRGVDDVASEEGYNVFLCNKDRSIQAENSTIEAMLSNNVDGIILFKPQVSGKRINEINKVCAVVVMDMDPELVDCDVINVDDYDGMANNVRTAIEGGHNRIAFISGLDGSASGDNRLKAYKDTLYKYNLPLRAEYCVEGDFTLEGGMQTFHHLISLPDPPTVILTSNDQMAKGILIMAHTMGIKIPNDISVIGYDDISDAKWTYPALTTNWQPKYEWGFKGTELLVKRIKQRLEQSPYEREVISMQTIFRMRESFKKHHTA